MPVLFRDFRVRDVSVEAPEIEEVVRPIYEGKLLTSELATSPISNSTNQQTKNRV
jgi:hypothetical protein